MNTKRLNFVFAIAICLMLVNGFFLPAHGKSRGGAKPGGDGGNTGTGYQIAQLATTDGVGLHDRANDINDLREVVGQATLPSGDTTAGYWTVGETDGVVESTLSFLDGGHIATAVNNLGEIVGQTYGESGNPLGVYWASPSSSAIVLPLPPGFDVSLPDRINDNSVICGMVAIDGESQSSIPVLWQVNGDGESAVVSPPIMLPSFGPGSSAQDINNGDSSGVFQVVGMQRTTWTPLLWEVQTLPDGTLSIPAAPNVLDPVGGAFATGINNSGIICGRTETDAVVWSGSMASILDRPGKGKNQVATAWAWDIGGSGIVVGRAGSYIDTRACVWDGVDGALTYLDDFLDADSPLVGLSNANAVNAFDDVVGGGWYGAFIAIPASP